MTNPTIDPEGDIISAIAARLDKERLDAAALWAARQLDTIGVARVNLAPGDATVYRFTIVAPSIPQYPNNEMGLGNRADYVVSLAGVNGNTYAWGANAHLHPRYAAEKWAPSANESSALYTGVVVAMFLNRVWANLTI